MMAKVFLKEDRYGEKLLKTLNVLRKERKYSDFYIETNSGLVPVHRVVLAAAESCHLKSKGFLCGDINTFDLTEFNKKIVETLVSYLYTGEVDLTSDSDIKDFVNLCKKLDFQSLLNRKEFQKGNSNEVSKKHTNELFENNTVNNQDSESEPHPIYLATNRDGQMFVKSVSTVHSNDNHMNHDNHDIQNTNVSNTPKLPESTEGHSLQEFIIKQEPNSDDDNSENELDSMEEESGSSQSNKLKQKRSNEKTLKGKNKKLKSSTESVKQYAEQLVSKVVGMGEEGGDVAEDSGDNNDNDDDAGDADDQEESHNDFVIKEEQDTMTENVTIEALDESFHELINENSSAVSTAVNRTDDQDVFVCCFCGKKIKTKSGHRRHEISHSDTEKRRHECKICHKTFADNAHYLGHMNTHIGHKPFKCGKCNKQYTYQGSYKRHLKVCNTLNAKRFQCSMCPKRFDRKDLLTDHVTGKHKKGVAQYHCQVCNKGFRYRSSRSNHTRKKHH
ncbi:uncharacterized protein LOC143075266 isoform X3 [Mytilus galloprovincialis]|uniref:uncharacterized protein LOC143075266 isoform X3 n=1 Tax=Mytilus galloprovincialis TaxID=29158 RepID=UPI003F7CCD2D